MLLQSHAGCIHLLPSLPDAWQEGSITGLRARGNFGVDIYWQGGRLQRAIVSSDSGEPCTLRYGSHTLTFPTERGKAYVITLNAKGNLEKK